jgi:hypothetical protein
MNDFDQSAYQFFQVDYVPYISYPDTTLPEVIQRKITAGSSFLYNNAFCRLFGGFYYYAFFGYRHISFRIIRSEINKEDINPIDELVLKHWKLYE